MHKKNLVACIKVGGKILRESSERVQLPFGSEYSVFLKNLDSVRMQAKISIDGQEATGWLVIQPHTNIEVERFVKDLDRGNRFKFIERTESVEQHRGIQAEDGLVQVEFKREKVYEAPKVVEHHTYTHHTYDYPYYTWPPYYPYRPPYKYLGMQCNSSGMRSGSGVSGQSVQSSTSGSQNFNMLRSAEAENGGVLTANCGTSAMSFNDAGITVPGSLSNQRFVNVSGFETEESEVLILHLVGCVGKVQVKVAKTVDIRAVCQTCGKRAKCGSKFCSDCGTSFEVI
jgi:hypothetical protein